MRDPSDVIRLAGGGVVAGSEPAQRDRGARVGPAVMPIRHWSADDSARRRMEKRRQQRRALRRMFAELAELLRKAALGLPRGGGKGENGD